MRHNKKFNHLGRKSAHRKALLSNMACSLILHKRISTTVAKAKALKMYVEPLITKSKEDNTSNRRLVFSYLKSKTAVSELFRDISVKIADRPGGYTRILKTGTRLGDAADLCIIELVDYNEAMLSAKDGKKAVSRRSRRGAGKKKEIAPVTESKKAVVEKPASKEPVSEAKAETTENEEIKE
jgi:large subunit ribosomal protein L17